ncbi:apolipoprotein N-acyltransferase [Kushneria phosphatilytica]|uniref:Apolipoprotein N-acyltransferase n=1 Tax=Kushneria phosphatilytica TaxID=657387 RepID=A0A1S1NY03_9GAMM|nr:apolipoprotein N-acyltransferase [Kushneria phosphatilytica]OHV12317.1 apolipoprotein N-acyltransferase [Kushneria phosphatilytica]QEL11524.1 apolipoprotein N-acyltransferase [Kushneria phosphatilytica]
MISLVQRPWLGHLAALLAGALTTLTFAPFSQWWIGLITMAVLFGVLGGCGVRRGALRGWLFGVGLFGTGTSWVYVSIHDYGYTSIPVALLLTGLFVVTLALFQAATFALYRLISPSRLDPLSFAGMYTLGEAFRSWAFTGFPWLYLGSAHVESPLASLAPLGGVYLISLFVALSGALIWQLVLKRCWWWIPALAALWMIPMLLPRLWVSPEGNPITVALVQGDQPQLEKWTRDGQRNAANTYAGLTRQITDDPRLVIWPETALPLFADQAMPFLESVQATLPANSTLVTGILQRKQDRYYNSVMALNQPGEAYRKAHLVPFGEYLPLSGLLRGIVGFFDLPMSNMSAGDAAQPPLQVGPLRLGVAICYEIVYPDLVRQRAENANVLLTVSNDAWFGHSIGPLQHMQMAQLRALENNRYLLRGTNNGMTAIVGPDGRVTAQAPRFTPAVLEGSIRPIRGETPFTHTGSWPTLVGALLLAVAGGVMTRRRSNV